jgi:hypothetical protein
VTDLLGGEAAARAIHRAMAKPVRYTMRNHSMLPVLAVRTHGPAGVFMEDQTARQLTFEIRKEDLPGRPVKGNELTEDDGNGVCWRVIEVVDLDDVDAWRVVVAE